MNAEMSYPFAVPSLTWPGRGQAFLRVFSLTTLLLLALLLLAPGCRA